MSKLVHCLSLFCCLYTSYTYPAPNNDYTLFFKFLNALDKKLMNVNYQVNNRCIEL